MTAPDLYTPPTSITLTIAVRRLNQVRTIADRAQRAVMRGDIDSRGRRHAAIVEDVLDQLYADTIAALSPGEHLVVDLHGVVHVERDGLGYSRA